MIAELSSRIDELSKLRNENRASLAQKTKEVEDLKARLHAIHSKEKLTKETLRNQVESIRNLEKERKRFQVHNEELQSSIRRIKDEKKELGDELDELRKKYDLLDTARKSEKKKASSSAPPQHGSLHLSQRQDQADHPRPSSHAFPAFSPSSSPQPPRKRLQQTLKSRPPQNHPSDDSDSLIILPRHIPSTSYPDLTPSSDIEELSVETTALISGSHLKRAALEADGAPSKRIKGGANAPLNLNSSSLDFRRGKTSALYTTGPRHKVNYRIT
ncbi:uncharacterized protein EI90DRAFT_3150946 [Cantharellus anzutake]|uniref:uncharacterized protein n=1 Tax=Cantharellus anzutake TaxID=1750568 RepID=UPI001903A1B3|nr:uncharacterized protein EI90DRAFT_3150946 [Cantharellus anzutake]KAF8340625.1 hypothetical protein EI90DRAFT_3150946 [Cantharellus anzutake]